jgi:curved DNA-binding protein CbpA
MSEIAWYWHFLGLKPGASKAEIKSAYHRLAKLLHRDHGGTDEDMQRLNEAYHLALADHGPAYQEARKTEPRHEPPPPQPPKAEQPWSRYGRERPREPFFTPTARSVVRGLINWAS